MALKLELLLYMFQILLQGPLSTNKNVPWIPRAEAPKLPSVWTRGMNVHTVQLSCCCLPAAWKTGYLQCLPPAPQDSAGSSGFLSKEKRKQETLLFWFRLQQTYANTHVKLLNLSSHPGCQCLKQIMLYLTGSATLSLTLFYWKEKRVVQTVNINQVVSTVSKHIAASIRWKSCAALKFAQHLSQAHAYLTHLFHRMRQITCSGQRTCGMKLHYKALWYSSVHTLYFILSLAFSLEAGMSTSYTQSWLSCFTKRFWLCAILLLLRVWDEMTKKKNDIWKWICFQLEHSLAAFII